MHNGQPFIGAAFAFRDQSSYPVHQNFCTGTWQRIHAGFFQGLQYFVVTFLFQFADVGHFGRPECMQLNGGIFLLDLPESVRVKIQSKPGVVPSLQQQLVAAVLNGFFNFLAVRGHVGNVRLRVAGNAVEIAKLAISNAHVGRIHIPVDLPGHFSVRHFFLAQLVGYVH